MVKIIEHRKADDNILSQIIEIKSLSWNYSKEEHLKWIKNNLKDDDLHFMFYENGELIGYLNLVNINILSKNEYVRILGVGNVCTKYKGAGNGQKLMEEMNAFLLKSGKGGLLFCKNNLVGFYKKCHWRLIQNLHPNHDINTMIYNFIFDTDLKYNDKLF